MSSGGRRYSISPNLEFYRIIPKLGTKVTLELHERFEVRTLNCAQIHRHVMQIAGVRNLPLDNVSTSIVRYRQSLTSANTEIRARLA